jgi:ornithine cyclodeaminase
VIGPEDVVADFYDQPSFRRHDDAEITVFKNGGGAHLDLMVSRHILETWQGR